MARITPGIESNPGKENAGIETPSPLLTNDWFSIVALAARHAIPTLYWRREFAEVGGLMSYGSDLADAFRAIAILGSPSLKEESVYAAIRQGKAKTGMAEELARRIKEGAIPIISDVEGFMAYYVVYAPDDTVTAISIFNDYAGAEESNRRVLAWIEQNLAPLLAGPATAMAGPVIVHTLA